MNFILKKSIKLFLKNRPYMFCNWIFTLFLVAPAIVRGLLTGESFYAVALSKFYRRQFAVINGKVNYIDEVGFLNMAAFIYQSFLAIYICYFIMGRRLYVVAALITLYSYALYVCGLNVLPVILIVSLSHIVVYIIIERGNYQMLGMVFSIIFLLMINDAGLTMYSGIIGAVAVIFSVSMFMLLSYSISFYYLAGIIGLHEWMMIALLFAGSLMVLLMCNYIYLSNSAKRSAALRFKLMGGIKSVLGLIGVKETQKKLPFKRQVEYVKGAVATLPILLLIPIFINTDYFIVIVGYVFLMFVNQSKLLRFFDYHLLYLWCFLFVAFVGFSEINTLTDYVLLFLFGSNPILLYAMNNYSKGINRALSINVPASISSQQYVKIEKHLSILLCGVSKVVIVPMSKNIQKYNDLWSKESLFLEFIWDALAKEQCRFFPDWYSIFYTDTGVDCFDVVNRGDYEHIDYDHCITIQTKNDAQTFGCHQLVSESLLVDIFSAEVVSFYIGKGSESLMLQIRKKL